MAWAVREFVQDIREFGHIPEFPDAILNAVRSYGYNWFRQQLLDLGANLAGGFWDQIRDNLENTIIQINDDAQGRYDRGQIERDLRVDDLLERDFPEEHQHRNDMVEPAAKRARIQGEDDNNEPDDLQAPATSGGSIMPSTNIGPTRHQLTVKQRFNVGTHTEYEYRTFETSIRFAHSIKSTWGSIGGKYGQCICIPWRSLTSNFGTDYLFSKTSGVQFWKPVSAECSLEDMECYTDVKAGENINPVQLQNVNVKAIKNDFFVCPRICAFDSVDEMVKYDALVNAQTTGAISKDLPKTLLFHDYDFNDAYPLQYNSDYWAEKPLTQETSFRWNWKHKNQNAPWRSVNELLTPPYYKLDPNIIDPPGQQTTNYSAHLSNFDYDGGIIQKGIASNYFYALKATPTVPDARQSFLINDAKPFQKEMISPMYTSKTQVNQEVWNYSSEAERNQKWGNAHKTMPIRDHFDYYEENNLMPEVYIDFTRKMNGPNIQPFTVHGQIRLKYVIKVVKNRIKDRTDVKIGRSGQYAQIERGMVSRIPEFVMSGSQSQTHLTDYKDKHYFNNNNIRYYIPKFQLIPFNPKV